MREQLAEVDVEVLSDRERVDLVAELERLKGAAAAGQARATHAVRCSREEVAPQDVGRSVGSEVALARRQSPTSGDRLVGLARALVTEMPETMRALTAGVCSERHAVVLVQATACLSAEDRGVVDRRVGPLLGRLGVGQAEAAAKRVAAELDAASIVARMEAAVRTRRVTVRPAPDGMAYLTVLGPMQEVVGAHAALQARSRAVVGGQCPEEPPGGRGVGAVSADTALRLLSGREVGQPQPVEVHLVMTDRALLGAGDPDRSVMEPARVPGHGPVPAPVARAWLRHGSSVPGEVVDDRGALGANHGATQEARVWVRRLYTTPDGRDLVGMDSRRRLFGGLLRRMLVLRDDVCTTPWCGAPIAHADHATPVREGGATSFSQGCGKCARCNFGKEAPGWLTQVVGEPTGGAAASAAVTRARLTQPRDVGAMAAPPKPRRRRLRVRTPVGRIYESEPPPMLGWGSDEAPALLGWGSDAAPATERTECGADGERRHESERWGTPTDAQRADQVKRTAGDEARATRTAAPWGPGRKRPCRRTAGAGRRVPRRRPRLTSHLELELCRLLV